MSIIIPMAGFGKRFSDAGYTNIKPLIPVTHYRNNASYPMVIAATKDLVQHKNITEPLIFILRNHPDFKNVQDQIIQFFPNAQFKILDFPTKGQACTCLEAKLLLNPNDPVLIGACDNGMLYDIEKFNMLKQSSDCIVFTFSDPVVTENPAQYGWVVPDKKNKETVKKVSVKIPISKLPEHDYAIVGAFWFKHFSLFEDATKLLIERNITVNNEFYVDSVINIMIQSNNRVSHLPVKKYLCWGTPTAYETYEKTLSYWKNFSKTISL